LTDRRNCISEYSKIKKCIPNNYLNFFRNENEDIDNEAKSRNKMKSLNNLKLTDIKGKIINAKDVKVKIIQNILNKKSLPKCQDKWNNFYNEEFHWPNIWTNLKRLDISNTIKEFQWKCIHNIIYVESRLRTFPYPMENIIFVKNQIVKKISNTLFQMQYSKLLHIKHHNLNKHFRNGNR
jgi:hypothetical protein